MATDSLEAREEALAAASMAVQRGELVVLPTDTVYGIGADAFDAEAVQSLLDAKGRGREMPPPVLISSATTLDALATGVTDYARRLVDRFWPGPLTLVCNQQPSLQWDLGDTRGTVAVRMPDHRLALDLLERTGPMAVSSANLTGHPAAVDADMAEEMLADHVAVIIDDGPVAGRLVLDDRRRARPPRQGAADGCHLARGAQRGTRGHGQDHRGRGLGGTALREYVLVFMVAATVTYLLTVIAREIALRTGAVAKVRDRDVHAEPIPYLGGLAMLGGLVAAYFLARELPFLSSRSDAFVFRDAGVVLIAGALICAVGTLDDLFELDALTKLGGQILAAGFLVFQNVQYIYFSSNDTQFIIDPAQGALLTVFIVVATVNAVNFVDGLDGLAAGVVCIGALAFFAFCYQVTRFNDQSVATTGALLSAMLAGACIGFLPHNINPARLFMGDSGSMLIGLVLSASAITLTGQFNPEEISKGAMGSQASFLVTLLPVLLPLAILVVPLADLVLAVIRRTRAGRSPMAPDKQHLHHRLLEIGHSQRRAVLIMWMWAALIAFGMVLASLYTGPLMWGALAIMFALTVLMTFVLPVVKKPALLDRESSDAVTP